MACCTPVSANVSKVCGPKKGGLIKDIYMANFCEVLSTTLTNDEVSAITMAPDPLTTYGPTYVWYKLDVKKSSAGFTNPINIGDSKFFNQTLTFTIEGFDTATKLAFQAMLDGEAMFIGVDGNGVAHLMGRISGAEMTEGSIGTGVAITDLVGGTVTFVAPEIEIVRTITAGVTIEVLDDAGTGTDTVTL